MRVRHLKIVRLVLRQPSPALAYFLAALISTVAILITANVWSLGIGEAAHPTLLLAAVVFSALIGGIGPGLLATVIATLTIAYYLPPNDSLAVLSKSHRIWLVAFLVISIIASWLGNALKKALQAGEKASLLLEAEVNGRTAELSQVNAELRKTVERLRESSEFLDSLIDNIPNPIFVLEARDLKVVRMNRAGVEIFGMSTEEAQGKTVYDLMPPDRAKKVQSWDREALDQKKIIDSPEIQLKAGNVLRTYQSKRIPLLGTNGKPAYLLVIAEDVTERINLDEERLTVIYEQAARVDADRRRLELEEALRSRDTFLSICGHELRTPLTTLGLQAGLIRKTLGQAAAGGVPCVPERVLDVVRDSEKEINRISVLVDDMLDVARIRTGRLTLHKEDVNLDAIVKESIEGIRQDPTFSAAEFHVSVEDGLLGCWDRNRIIQVVVNLLSNALKYGGGKPIDVRGYLKNGRILLEVEDRGIGIEPGDQERIFKRFERAIPSGGVSGLGLGLYIVKEIVDGHGGRVWVRSSKGEGSRFTVELPAVATTSGYAA